MAANSNIEWTEATWNCVVGCEAVSPGCAHCYAQTMTRRLEGMGQKDYAGLTTEKHFNGVVRCLPHKLDIPLKRRKPTTYFVNSMSDLFHEDVPDEFIDRVFAVMAIASQHKFQVLTKRAERMADYCRRLPGTYMHQICDDYGAFSALRDVEFPLPNVWLGVSAEDQQRADERIPWLLKTPAAVRFLSCEPLLGPIDLRNLSVPGTPDDAFLKPIHECRSIDSLEGMSHHPLGSGALGFRCPRVNWVIVGGESGHGARPCDTSWVRSIVRQCRDAGVSCFVKQMGSNPQSTLGGQHTDTGTKQFSMKLVSKKGGDPEEWPHDLRVRQMPVSP